MSIEFDRGSPGKFDSRTVNRKTLSRWTGRVYIYIYICIHQFIYLYMNTHTAGGLRLQGERDDVAGVDGAAAAGQMRHAHLLSLSVYIVFVCFPFLLLHVQFICCL